MSYSWPTLLCRNFVIISLIAGLWFGPGLSFAGDLIATVSPPRFKQGDDAFRERIKEDRAREALKFYRKLYEADKKDVEAAWRLSMTCYYVGTRFLKEGDEQRDLFSLGRDAGQVGIKADSKCAACYFWAAINMALFGQATGPFKMYFSLGEIKDYMEKSVAIDPTYAYGGAYRLMGQIEEGLPGILGGSNDRAKAYYEKAIRTVPDEPLNYLFLANLLREDLDDKPAALKVVKRALGMKAPGPDRVESLEALQQIKDLAVKLERDR